MPSANLKRIEELEQQLDTAKRNNQRLEAEKYRLAAYLSEIHVNHEDDTASDLQELAAEALNLTGALTQLQQRDLKVAYNTVVRMKFPVEVRKQWSGGEVQHWIQSYAEVLRQRALAQLEPGKDTVQ